MGMSSMDGGIIIMPSTPMLVSVRSRNRMVANAQPAMLEATTMMTTAAITTTAELSAVRATAPWNHAWEIEAPVGCNGSEVALRPYASGVLKAVNTTNSTG